MSSPSIRRTTVVALALAAQTIACVGGGDDSPPPEAEPVAVSVPFVGVVGDDVFACGTSYALGSGGAQALASDFRFYVHDLAVIDDSGDAHVVTLDDGGFPEGAPGGTGFQAGGHALVDFEDGSAACQTGSSARHAIVTGSIDDDVTIAGVRFTVGVAPEQNKLDVSSADAPLNVPGLYWSWANGYKHMRADLAVGVDEAAVRFHLGAAACAGDPGSIACGDENTPVIELDLDIDSDAVAVDLAALYAGVDLEAELAEGDGVKGCMSGLSDPECPAMFGAVGLGVGDAAPVAADAAFAVRAGGRADAEALEE